jgi:DNA-binding response OmpR family regulator
MSDQIDTRRRALSGPLGETILTAREFALASELFARPGDVLTRSHLLNSAWGSDFERTYNVVDVYVGYLRAKLSEVGAQDVAIVAVRGMGYRMTQALHPGRDA